MHTAFIAGFGFSTTASKPKGFSLDEFKWQVASNVVGNPYIFNCEGGTGYCEWTWTQDARRTYLIPFLSRFYADFYGEDSREFLEYCKPVLDFLATDPSDQDLLNWAEEYCYHTFYPMDDWQGVVEVNGKEITVNLSVFSLTSEGKVMYEEMEQHLTFLEEVLRKAYADNPFGQCLTIDVG
jgi:hypothetical protein